jgi:hypothetical protein
MAGKPPQPGQKGCMIIMLVILGGLAVIGLATKPATFGDYKDSEKQACINSKGDGQWPGSFGSLDSFCEALATGKMHEAYCSEHPEAC